MTFLTTPVVKISRMRKQWIPGPLPSRLGPGDEATRNHRYYNDVTRSDVSEGPLVDVVSSSSCLAAAPMVKACKTAS